MGVREVNDSDFKTSVLDSDKPTLVDFWAAWCGPCRMIAPSVEAVAEQFGDKANIMKMDVDANIMTPQQYGVKGIPTLILFKNGAEADRVVGAVSREAIAKLVEKHLNKDEQAVGNG
jgi:thioredoxin 1